MHDVPLPVPDDQRALSPQPEYRYLGADDIDQVVALVFELAGQLHEQRARLIAVERALEGARHEVPHHPFEHGDPAAQVDRELQESLDGLFAVLREVDDARRPLRSEQAPKRKSGQT